MERSFHISHAALQVNYNKCPPQFPYSLFEVHAIVEKTDYILCYLGAIGYPSSTCTPSVQQPLNLNISEGEEIILYVTRSGIVEKAENPSLGSVYLTGYVVDEPTFAPNLDDLLEDDEYTLDEESSAEETNDEEMVLLEEEGEKGEEGGEGEGEGDEGEQALTNLLLEGSLADSDSEDDEDFVLDGGDLLLNGNMNTRKRLARPPVIEEIEVCVCEFVCIIV